MNLKAVFQGLKGVAKVAVPVVSMLPGYGPIIGSFANAVLNAEAAMPDSPGKQKATLANTAMEPDIPTLIAQMEQITGSTLTDPIRFLAYRQKQMEAMVELFHAFGVFDPKTK